MNEVTLDIDIRDHSSTFYHLWGLRGNAVFGLLILW